MEEKPGDEALLFLGGGGQQAVGSRMWVLGSE